MTDTRRIILEKALIQFIKKGYGGASLAEICKTARITKGALYHYFSSKEVLYEECLQSFFERTSLPAWVTDDYPTPRELVIRVFQEVDASCEWIRSVTRIRSDNAILYFNQFLYEATRRYPEYQRRIDGYDEEIYRRLEGRFRDWQRQGSVRSNLDARLLAVELYALQQQLIYLRFVNPWIKRDEGILRGLAEQFWKEIGGENVL